MMPKIAVVLKHEILRLARKEIRSQSQGLQKATAQFRRDIAGLKRHASKLQTEVTRLERQVRKDVASAHVAAADAKSVRFTAKGLRSQRKLLGISAEDYASLLGVHANTVYKWEHGESRPGKPQLAALASLRGVGKKETLARLEQLSRKSSKRRKKA